MGWRAEWGEVRLEGGPVARRDKLGPCSWSPHSHASATWGGGVPRTRLRTGAPTLTALCREHPSSAASRLNSHLLQPGKQRLRGTKSVAWEHLAGMWSHRGLRGIGLSRLWSPGYEAVVRDLNSAELGLGYRGRPRPAVPAEPGSIRSPLRP